MHDGFAVVGPLDRIVRGFHGVDMSGVQMQLLRRGRFDSWRAVQEGVADAVIAGFLWGQPCSQQAVGVPDRRQMSEGALVSNTQPVIKAGQIVSAGLCDVVVADTPDSRNSSTDIISAGNLRCVVANPRNR